MIRGKKNFLPPHPLVMGFGILFRLDESSLASHLNERRVRGEDEDLDEMVMEPRKEQSNSDSDEEIIEEGDTSKESENHLDPSMLQPNVNADIMSEDDATVTINSESTTPNPSQVFPRLEAGERNFLAGSSSEVNDSIESPDSSQLDLLLDKALGLGPVKLSSKSTGFDVHDSTAAETPANEDKKGTGREKPYISKAERRKLKKGQKNTSDTANGFEENENGIRTSDMQLDSNETLRAANPKITRGQKGKLKKIKEKYAEQDEEERRLRMALLAVS